MNRTSRILLYGFKQIKFVRSFQDARVLYTEKLPYLIPRLRDGHIGDKTVPPSLQLEPTNYCNLRCISCPQHHMQRPKGHMGFSLFEKIINDAAGIGVKRVHLYLHGEPLLHAEIVRMIAYIKSRHIGVSIFTNGMMLDKEMGGAILKSGVNSADYITFSIQGYSPEVHEKLMAGVNHERVAQNIADFVALRRERRVNGPIIQTIFYRMPENEYEAGQYLEKWEKVVDQALCSTISKSFENYKKEGTEVIPPKKNRAEPCGRG
jgi:sulfatase maturation enzyme AslB (radical SAM superfamily)